jgi:hypothetical protein
MSEFKLLNLELASKASACLEEMPGLKQPLMYYIDAALDDRSGEAWIYEAVVRYMLQGEAHDRALSLAFRSCLVFGL